MNGCRSVVLPIISITGTKKKQAKNVIIVVMDRGKSSLEKDVISMLNDIKYFRDLNGTDIFEYTIGDGKISPFIIDYDIQEKLLERMNNDGIIKIAKRKQVLSPTLSWVDEPLANRFSHTVYILDTSETTFPKNPHPNKAPKRSEQKTYNIGISFEDIDNGLYLSINNNAFHKIRRLSAESEPYYVLRALFFQPTKPQFSKYDIFPKGNAERRNLAQIISKANLDFLVDYGFITVDKNNIKRIKNAVTVSDTELKTILSKINENYRKQFSQYL